MLPLAGGLFDQPAGYMSRMESVLIATSEQDKANSNARDAKQRADQRAREEAK